MKTDRRGFLRHLAFSPLVIPPLLRQPTVPVEMKVFDAATNSGAPIDVYLNGKRVSDMCTVMYAPAKPDVLAEGWCELFTEWPPVIDPNWEPLTEIEYGLVEWRSLKKSRYDNLGMSLSGARLRKAMGGKQLSEIEPTGAIEMTIEHHANGKETLGYKWVGGDIISITREILVAAKPNVFDFGEKLLDDLRSGDMFQCGPFRLCVLGWQWQGASFGIGDILVATR